MNVQFHMRRTDGTGGVTLIELLHVTEVDKTMLPTGLHEIRLGFERCPQQTELWQAANSFGRGFLMGLEPPATHLMVGVHATTFAAGGKQYVTFVEYPEDD
jgi:phosphatidylethanolamine-binding protein (PEBP) family uncharacterized protein